MSSTQPDREPLLKRIPDPIAVPPMLLQPGVDQLGSPAQMPSDPEFNPPTFVSAVHDAQKRKIPQCIAHRGYKAKFPENTLGAFKGAVAVGAHAIETDLHITKDEVVVISHDATLKRCFGKPDKIIDRTWEELKDLRTVQEPHEPMPRLLDLLAYLAEPGMEEIWLLLDIKLDNNPRDIMRLIGSTLAAAPASAQKAWHERVVLGIWAAKYLPLALEYMPKYPVMDIAFSLPYARHFLTVPNVGFNMLLPILIAPGGKKFLRQAREHKRQVLAWTVNDEDKMKWCIRRKLDGVLTDDPQKYLEVVKKFDPDTEKEPMVPIGWTGVWDVFRIWAWISIMLFFFKKRFAPVASRELIRAKAHGQ